MNGSALLHTKLMYMILVSIIYFSEQSNTLYRYIGKQFQNGFIAMLT